MQVSRKLQAVVPVGLIVQAAVSVSPKQQAAVLIYRTVVPVCRKLQVAVLVGHQVQAAVPVCL